jgi:hypothetical protein
MVFGISGGGVDLEVFKQCLGASESHLQGRSGVIEKEVNDEGRSCDR